MNPKNSTGLSRYLGVFCLLAPVGLVLTGCGTREFDFNAVQNMLEANKIPLDGEQIMLTDTQVTCGQQNDLWDVTPLGPGRSIGRLSQAARDLHFGDDVVIGEPGTRFAYVQLRGSFQLRVQDVGSARNDGQNYKLAEVKVGVEIPHPCFADPLPQMMAVRRGRFTQDASPTFRFRTDGDWAYDRVQH